MEARSASNEARSASNEELPRVDRARSGETRRRQRTYPAEAGGSLAAAASAASAFSRHHVASTASTANAPRGESDGKSVRIQLNPVPHHFIGTAFEELSLALHDAHVLAEEAVCASDAAGVDENFDRLLNRLCDKIRVCVDRLDSLNTDEVNVRSLIRGKSETEAEGGLQNTGIADFIEDQFTHARRHSQGNFLRQKSISAGGSSLRRLPTIGASDGRHGSLVSACSAASSSAPAIDLNDLGSGPGLQTLVEGLDDWGLDLFLLEQETSSRALEAYSRFVLEPTAPGIFDCSKETLFDFIRQVASNYSADCQYHNAIHAAQVLHSGTWLTRRLLAGQQSELEAVAFSIAAICHDVKHFGRNNAFCINTSHPLAITYNDARVLESMHAATCFELMRNVQPAGVNMLEKLSKDDRQGIRTQIVDFILATDMAEHFEMLGRFRVRLDSPEFDIFTPADRTLVARMCMKAADIGHSSLPWDIHRRWSIRVAQEFFQQGDEERRLGIGISALCDRAAAGDVGKSQKGFLQFVCLPLFEALATSESLVEHWSEAEAAETPSGSRRQSGEEGVSPEDVEPQVPASEIQKHCISEIERNARRWIEDTEDVKQVVLELTSAGGKTS